MIIRITDIYKRDYYNALTNDGIIRCLLTPAVLIQLLPLSITNNAAMVQRRVGKQCAK